MDFVASISYGYTDYEQAAELLCDQFGFSVLLRDEISITVNNGVLSVRIYASHESELPLHLDMEATDYKEAINRITTQGFRAITDHQNPTPFRIEQRFKGPHGITVTVYQVLTEDDLDIPTDLKITLDWEPEAVTLAQTLLKHVSLNFRELARSKMVQQAESFALIEGTMLVTVDFMVTAFLYTTPNFKQEDLQRLLLEHGISQEFINQQLEEM